MAIVRWNPARDLMQMREEMDRLFSQFLRRSDGEEVTWARGLWAPSVEYVPVPYGGRLGQNRS